MEPKVVHASLPAKDFHLSEGDARTAADQGKRVRPSHRPSSARPGRALSGGAFFGAFREESETNGAHSPPATQFTTYRQNKGEPR